MVIPIDPPRAMPSVPCLSYAGLRVRWDRWERGLDILCAKLDQSCPCGHPGPQMVARGILEAQERTREIAVPISRSRGERRQWVTRVKTQPAGDWWRLMAYLCPDCFRLDVHDMPGAPAGCDLGAEVVLCDGCDVSCGVGIDMAEARANLVALGGWSASDADWDLCAACNPARNPDAPPRALAAFRAARTVDE